MKISPRFIVEEGLFSTIKDLVSGIENEVRAYLFTWERRCCIYLSIIITFGRGKSCAP